MTLSFKHSAVMMAALMGATLSTAALAEKGPMGGQMGAMLMNFDALDADKDGKLTVEELAQARSTKFAEADSDKDGKLSADELLAMREKAVAAHKAQMAENMIARLDSDKDGFVSAAELEAMPMGKNMGEKMFSRLDADADGAISKQEAEAARGQMAGEMGEGQGKHRKGGEHKEGGRHGGGFWNWMMGGEN